jgi:hypothetical protein
MRQGGTIVAATLACAGMLMSQAALSQAVRSKEPAYSVISPLGEDTVSMIEMTRRLDTLSNKTVCMVTNNDFKANITIPVIEKTLKEGYPGLKVVSYSEFPTAYSGTRWEALADLYRSKGCDAVIAGNGG